MNDIFLAMTKFGKFVYAFHECMNNSVPRLQWNVLKFFPEMIFLGFSVIQEVMMSLPLHNPRRG